MGLCPFFVPQKRKEPSKALAWAVIFIEIDLGEIISQN
ncbi:hypothetical protein X474_04230 [Dethiosulfatarculus sandiegensis]|uniref:Uncharacterized protein n=1 Tax=Dethiosulfatarculus sandiegensis TaxID=1429043 RepID=A0A0D2HYX9_9BACT|nr:hypothetical protein X474_04230 [Dethiosulfatarculus sandiegensis]